VNKIRKRLGEGVIIRPDATAEIDPAREGGASGGHA